jgi:hypothetical protein
MTRFRIPFGLAVILVGLAALGASADDSKNDGFTPLFNGKDLGGWKTVLPNGDPAKTWTVEGGVIICTGHPNGFLYTEKSYKNYVFRYDWMYTRPKDLKDDSTFLGNSGALMHIHDPKTPAVGGLWPQCVEVQGMNRDHGKLFFLKAKKIEDKWDKAARDKAVKPVGEWNTTEIVCAADGTITAKINGTSVSEGKSDLTEGHIGLQSEGAEIHFRNLSIKEMK